MTTRKITCIACPRGCQLTVELEGGRVVKLTGNKCEKGVDYAGQEILNPARMLTTTVLTKGLSLKLVPVRTSGPIPKEKLFEAMDKIKEIRLDRPVKAGESIIKDLAGTGADLIAVRETLLFPSPDSKIIKHPRYRDQKQ